jgi:membrane associated rhomboid family serine protease
MLSMIIVYGIATVVGVLVALTYSLLEGVVAGFAALGGLVTSWILVDTVKEKIEGFYEKKYAPKKSTNSER